MKAYDPTRIREYETGELLKRFAPYLWKYKGVLVLDLMCASLTTVCDLVLPLIMRYITSVGLSDATSLSLIMILKLGLLYLVLRVIECLMGAKVETDMRTDAYAHLQRLSDTYYNNTKIGQIMGRITNDLFDVTEFAHHCPEELLIAVIKCTVSFVILAGINIYLTLIIFAIIPVMMFVCGRINMRFRRLRRLQRAQIGELNASIEDSLLGQKVVKAFTNEELEERKFAKGNELFFALKKSYYVVVAWFHTSIKMFDAIIYLVTLVAGSLFIHYGMIQAADLVAFLLYVTTLLATVRRIVDFMEQFQMGITGIDRFLQLMDAEIEIFDEPDATELKDIKGEIVFNNVSFEYPDDQCLKILILRYIRAKGLLLWVLRAAERPLFAT